MTDHDIRQELFDIHRNDRKTNSSSPLPDIRNVPVYVLSTASFGFNKHSLIGTTPIGIDAGYFNGRLDNVVIDRSDPISGIFFDFADADEMRKRVQEIYGDAVQIMSQPVSYSRALLSAGMAATDAVVHFGGDNIMFLPAGLVHDYGDELVLREGEPYFSSHSAETARTLGISLEDAASLELCLKDLRWNHHVEIGTSRSVQEMNSPVLVISVSERKDRPLFQMMDMTLDLVTDHITARLCGVDKPFSAARISFETLKPIVGAETGVVR